jgi:hypothetical protein
MMRLRVEGGPPGSQDILLQPGLNLFGRGEDNDFPIRDDSVSTHHCQIEVKDGVITVWDLNSTNGTFLDGQPIQSAVLQPGRVLGLGNVKLLCEADAAEPVLPPVPVAVAMPRPMPAEAAPAEPVAPPAVSGAEVCFQHADVPAKWACVRCGTLLCASCVRTTRGGMKFFQNCPGCSGSCISITEYRRLANPMPTGFFALWRSAFSYPVKKDGVFLLVCGTVVFGFLDGARWVLSYFKFAGFLGLAYWLCLIMGIGYLFAFMQNIVQASSQGEEKMPDWPEISGFWDDLAVPCFRFGFVWFVCLGPGLAVMLSGHPLAGVPLLLLGLFCLPMAILTVCLADGIGGLNPVIIFSGIGKVPLPYLTICGIFLAVIALVNGVQMLLELTGIPILPTVISTFISLYGLTMEMRLLGLLYWTNKSKLAWFE